MTGLLAHLSRRTSSGRFIPEVDGLRFVAIAAVVLYHIAGFTESGAGRAGGVFDAAHSGRYGVQLFFMISGFILALPFAVYRLAGGPRPALGAYFVRRLTRLEPPYVIAMLGCFAALVVLGRGTTGDLWPHLLASLVYQHNLLYGTFSTINPVAWSLEIEVQFYCLAPVLAWLFAIRHPVHRRSAIVALAFVFAAASPLWTGRMSLTLVASLHFFLVGFLAADLYATGWPDALRSRAVSRVLGNRWIATIGGMCYSIYLLHHPIVSFIGHRTLPLGGLAVQVGLIVPVVLGVSTLYFVAIERPCMDRHWPQRLGAWWLRISGGSPSRSWRYPPRWTR